MYEWIFVKWKVLMVFSTLAQNKFSTENNANLMIALVPKNPSKSPSYDHEISKMKII